MRGFLSAAILSVSVLSINANSATPVPTPVPAITPSLQATQVAISPQNLSFGLYMNTDENHKEMENLAPSIPLSTFEQANRHTDWQYIVPLMRLDIDHIKALARTPHKITSAEGPFTIADLEVVSGSDHLAFLHTDVDGESLVEKKARQATSDLQYYQNNQALLLEDAHFSNGAFTAVYRWPGNDQINNKVVLRLSNIKIKNPHSDLGKFIESVVTYPEGVSIAQPSHKKRKKNHPATVVVQAPAPALAQPPVIVQSPPGPIYTTPTYVTPAPVVVEPPVVGGVIVEERFRHRHHHHW